MNKKIIALFAITIMLGSIAPVMALPAGTYTTQANAQPTSVGTPPVVKAKWETTDEDTSRPWTQINPVLSWNASKPITFWSIVTDDNGWDDVDSAYIEVFHPDGSKKFQIELQEIPICGVDGSFNQSNYDMVVAALTAADTYDSVMYGKPTGETTPYDLTEVIGELHQCSAKAFRGTELIHTCQICGEFDWDYQCVGTPPNCVFEWTPSNLVNGYRVEAYAFDKSGSISTRLINYFEYMCAQGLETDFNLLDYETVNYRTHKWVEGDYDWDILGPACKEKIGSLCVGPTIRNIGNEPVKVSVLETDMGFGYSGVDPKDWNVQWDARLGVAPNAVSIFNPEQKVTLDGQLDLCDSDKISFSIFAKKILTPGPHSGLVTLEPEDVTCPYTIVATGASYPGLYGSTVTPVTITNTNCSQVTALRIDKAMPGWAGGGWAGWSCVEVGYPNAVGGGVVGGVAAAQGLAEPGAPAVGGFNYPVYPHYTFPAGEEGWVAQSGSPIPTAVYVLCAP